MSKLIFSALLVILTSFTIPIVAHAESNVDVNVTVNGEEVVNESYSDDSGSSVKVNLKNQVNTQNQGDETQLTVREEVQQRVEEKKDTIKERFENRHRQVITNRCSFMKNFYNRVTNRFTHIIERLQSRTQKLSDAGFDTSPAEDLLDQVDDQQIQLQVAADTVGTRCDQLGEAENPRDAVQTLKDSLADFREQSKNLHALLVDTVHALKSTIPTPTEPETST